MSETAVLDIAEELLRRLKQMKLHNFQPKDAPYVQPLDPIYGRPARYVTLGEFQKMSVDVASDDWPSKTEQRMFVGFNSTTKRMMTAFLEQLPAHLTPQETRLGKDILKDEKTSYPKTQIPLRRRTAEFYGTGENYFSFYLPLDQGADEAADFLTSVMLAATRNDDLANDIQQIVLTKGTASTQLIEARLGQGKFRAKLMDRWKSKCCVSGYSIPQMLRASHIKPWSISSNDERLDPDNGLLLTANLDALFDKYLISFDEDGRMLVAETLYLNKIQEFTTSNSRIIGNLNDAQRGYLRYHRDRYLELAALEK